MKNLKFSLVIVLVAICINACDNKNAPEEKNKAALLKVHEELLDKNNLAFADEAISPDYAFPGMSGKGPALIKNFVTQLKTAFPDLKYKLDLVIAKGNLVAWRRTHTGTHKGEFMGYKPTGKVVSWQEVDITRFGDDGKIIEEWGSTDFDVNVQRASGIEGVYVNYGQSTGLSIYRNGYFSYVGSAPNSPSAGLSGTYSVDGEIMTNTVTAGCDPKQVGTKIFIKMKSWSGDTLTYSLVDSKGADISTARAIRTSY